MSCRCTALAALLLACGWMGCQTPPATPVSVFGLWPEQPALHYNATRRCFDWPRLEAVRPTLRWQSFPRPADLKADTNGYLANLRSVSYDLRIWESGGGFPAELVYSRDALPKPSHHLEKPLSQGTAYFWTVRARFDCDGQTRATEWSYIQKPRVVPGLPTLPHETTYPDPRYFRFSVR